jgi:hypothetical protein
VRVAFRLLIGLAVFLSALTTAAEVLTEVKVLTQLNFLRER